jgi:hypothetical protein
MAVPKSVPAIDPNKTERPDPAAFIGSMKGTIEITGDIIAPIDVQWEADQGSDQNHLL